MSKHKRRRIPKLGFTQNQGIGFYASYRDPANNSPRRKRFGMIPEDQAQLLYAQWLAEHMGGKPNQASKAKGKGRPLEDADTPALMHAAVSSGTSKPVKPESLLAIANNLLRFEESRTRGENDGRIRGTITSRVFMDRKKQLQDFLTYMNERHGQGALARMSLADLLMEDVEDYNRHIVKAGYSGSQVAKRMQIVKALINRAGRPELGQQVLSWNWDSMDRMHGKATGKRRLPSLPQLKSLLGATDARGRALIWMAIGLGFGQRDLAAVRVGQIDAKSYDLRRGKTGIERYGETPPLVWNVIETYLRECPRETGELLFVTRTGMPLVHDRSDSIVQWWSDLRDSVGASKADLGGFYTLRHLGATEYGSRDGISIGVMKRWLGHAASSAMADVYMKPVPPEQRALIEWVRLSLASGYAGGTRSIDAA